jgi:hypothetical protein
MAAKEDWAAEFRAAEVLAKLSISALPVNPFGIADAKGIEHKQNPAFRPGISGCLMKVGDIFGILYSVRFSSEGFRRFTVAHELGHYFMEGHVQHLFADGQQFHESQSGFTSDDTYEREADAFAAALLMPKQLFKAACARVGKGFGAIESLANLCSTSLTATGIRYAQLSDDPVAVVCSMGDLVQFVFMSKILQDRRDLTWIRKGSGLPMSTATARFNKNESNIQDAKRVSSSSSMEVWFDGGGDVEINEEVVGLGGYGKTLTVLWADSLPDPDESDDTEEDDLDNLMPSKRWRERG